MEKKNLNKKILYWVLIAVFAAVFVVSGTIVVEYLMESKEHQDMMEDIRDLHTRGPEDESTTMKPITRPSSSTAPSGSSSTATSVPGPSPSDTVPPSTGGDEIQPTEPTGPADPVDPTDPQPTDPQPTDPQPTDPQPTEPTTSPTEPTAQPTQPPTTTVPTKPIHVNTTILSEMKAVYDLNNDVVGWVYIKGTNIDYPVLQRKESPDYYIYRNIYGKEDKRGSIYAEEHCDVFNPSDVVVLHGHHMADGTMFNNIKYFLYDYYFEDHPYVQFDTLYERRKYEVVLLFRTNGEPHSYYPFFPFHTYNDFKNEDEFNHFMSSIRKLAVQESDVEVKYGDKLLCLSTCDYMPYPNGRIVLVCKLIEN